MVMPITRPGKSDLLADVMGGGLPAMLQVLSRSGPSMTTMPMLAQTCWLVYFSMP